MANITAFTDYNGTVPGTTLVTDTGHGIPATDSPIILITGTFEFNGVFEANYVDANTFYIERAYVSAESGSADAAVTSTDTSLTDTRLNMTVDAYIDCIITCNTKTMTITANTATAFSGTAWSGGGNPGNGNAWTLAEVTGTWARAAYAASYPLSSTLMSTSTEQIRANWEIIDDWWGTEHGGPTSATSGAHSIGRCGVLLVDATSAISAVSSPGTGSVALNTTLGEMQIYRYDSTNLTAGWEGITDQKFARIFKGFGEQTIAASTWTKILCAATGMSGTYDGLSEWSSYKYTAAGTGYYHVVAMAQWPATSSDYSKGVAIYRSGSRVAEKHLYGSAIRTLRLADTLYLTAAQYVEVYVYHDHTGPVDLAAGTINVVRVS